MEDGWAKHGVCWKQKLRVPWLDEAGALSEAKHSVRHKTQFIVTWSSLEHQKHRRTGIQWGGPVLRRLAPAGASLESTSGGHPWRAPMESTPEEHSWRAPMESTPGEHSWRVHMESTSGGAPMEGC